MSHKSKHVWKLAFHILSKMLSEHRVPLFATQCVCVFYCLVLSSTHVATNDALFLSGEPNIPNRPACVQTKILQDEICVVSDETTSWSGQTIYYKLFKKKNTLYRSQYVFLMTHSNNMTFTNNIIATT